MDRDLKREQEILEELKKIDTPSITNVTATYPKDKETCLGLYHPWYGKWYTDQSLKCMYPGLGPRCGYAVTCTYGVPSTDFNRLGMADLFRAIDAMPNPVVLIIKQNLPPEIKEKCGLAGGNMLTAFKSLGVVGVISDGPSRDLNEIEPMGVQYMLTGVTAGHGDFSLEAINEPVEVCGMMVTPGDIVHMDENGATKFPARYLQDVLDRAKVLQDVETKRQSLMRETSDVDEIIKIFGGIYD